MADGRTQGSTPLGRGHIHKNLTKPLYAGRKVVWDRKLDRRARLGITGLPEPLPHPDHVVIDLWAGTARIIGPDTKEAKAEWDMWHDRKAEFEHEFIDLEDMLRTVDDAKMRANFIDDIAQNRRAIDIIERGLTGRPIRG